jgi:hypothetical protein
VTAAKGCAVTAAKGCAVTCAVTGRSKGVVWGSGQRRQVAASDSGNFMVSRKTKQLLFHEGEVWPIKMNSIF